jgi:hypothetical protein
VTTEEFITKISTIGITAKVIDESTCRILGGRLRETSDDDDDIKVYSDAFSVYKEENTWVLITPGRGQFSVTEEYETLEKTIEKLYEFYGNV